jgi:hypothetical protein
MSSEWYDRQGHLLAMDEISAKFSDPEYKILAKTKVESADASVSTVWLGLDHSFGGGPPLIFESMVFGGGLDQHQWRYATEAEARTGHESLVEKVTHEAAAFRRLTVDRKLRRAVATVQAALETHREFFELGDYDDGSTYRRLVEGMAR